MSKRVLPDLTFPMVEYGVLEEPWDLLSLLYRGGAACKVKEVAQLIERRRLGALRRERVELVTEIHGVLADQLVAGGSKNTAKARIHTIRRFFAWIDNFDASVSLETVVTVFLGWTDHLLLRQRNKSLTEATTYSWATIVASVLDQVLGRTTSILKDSRIRKPRDTGIRQAISSEPHDLTEICAFGHILTDICVALTTDTIFGPLPVRIPLRDGHTIEEWSGLPDPLVTSSPILTKQGRETWAAKATPQARRAVLNLRIEAEMLTFIAQTGMNSTQASRMRVTQFHYSSHLDGYQVRQFKDRRQGEVAFEIFAEYREMFERYLAWRAANFPSEPDGLLFPILIMRRLQDEPPSFYMVRKICTKLGRRYVPPRSLRSARVNWLLRASHDPALTAEMAQHTKETMFRHYAKPDLQVAIVEIVRFHQKHEPLVSPPAPGECVGTGPLPFPDIPSGAAAPDCIASAGCLFCSHHRDIDSEDHVWSLASYRHLKSLELAKYHPPAHRLKTAPLHPAAIAVDRLTAKLSFFERSNVQREQWVKESIARTEEGDYHPAWDAFIQMAEMRHGN
ncbi:hypothetical protein LMG27952_02618 [Paraburkholderia hiiakae]|uniref:Phage integrase family protein n=1 Tax=Paraburkholderia hiiakae TaxID=1081782 RepID=A0ABM8NLL1_9BURK|nr:site-specific integrase [Paraburkholderia hiiakae]CAD6531753.1 hypothetical protein LMG27952_02618 [Paraburkholderia hiiakae]